MEPFYNYPGSIRIILEKGEPDWIDFIIAFGPFITGFAVAVVALLVFRLQLRQHTLDRERFKYQILDRRLAVYESFREILQVGLSPIGENDLNGLRDRIIEFRSQRGPVHFLFKPEHDLIYTSVVNALWDIHEARIKMVMSKDSDGPEYPGAAKDFRAAQARLAAIGESLPQGFEDYLRLSQEFM
ncbi:MAG: hypothetical protein FVQ81_18340 [Candidatus Glassbacteria bacterium]|nr:hypothetical protein [Candidatus Glassbacteria bacterium]